MTNFFSITLAVALGGALGSLLRYGITCLLSSFGPFPYSILLINTVGSFLMGFSTAIFIHRIPSSRIMKACICTGLLGGFTTFSTFSLDSVSLLSDNFFLAVFNLILNPVCSLIAVAAGWYTEKKLCH